jgi:choline-sulfatase
MTRRQLLLGSAAAARALPNILLLMSDEHRPDALGCAGNPVIRTPHLDRLAAEGVHFTRAWCQGPLCQPSRASILTGQYVHQHGQTWNGMNMKPEWPTFLKRLQAAGYYTAKIGKAHFAGRGSPSRSLDLRDNAEWNRRFGLDYILEEYDRLLHSRPGIITPYTEYLKSRGLLETFLKELPATGPGADRRETYRGKVSALPVEHGHSAFLGDQAVEWLRAYRRDQPFLLWVSFVEPHPPVIDAQVWADRYRDARLPKGPAEPPDLPDNAWGRYLRAWMRGTGSATMTAQEVDTMARHYYGKVSEVDRKIGDIRSALAERGLDGNTWILYTADHGEMLGDHKLVYKNVFYRPSAQVPAIVRPPGGMRGRSEDALVESIDLTATMLDAAGAEMPGCRGRSLVPFTRGAGKGREVAYSELAGHQNQGNFFVMAATARYRYVYDKRNLLACELFDLEKDPEERHNLVAEAGFAGIRKDMHKDYVQPFLEA